MLILTRGVDQVMMVGPCASVLFPAPEKQRPEREDRLRELSPAATAQSPATEAQSAPPPMLSSRPQRRFIPIRYAAARECH
jgi:hypothetical protein